MVPWWREPANIQPDRAALLGGRFDIEDLLEDEEEVAQYLCGGEPADMSGFADWCKENGALRLCMQAALDYPGQPVYIDAGNAEWLDAFHQFGAPHGITITAACEPAAASGEDRDPGLPGSGGAPHGLPLDRPDEAAQLARKYLMEGKVTAVEIHLRADPPVPVEVWKALEDGVRHAAHLHEVLLRVDFDDEAPCGSLLEAVAASSQELRKVVLNLRNLPKPTAEDAAAMTALIHKRGLEQVEVESGGDTLNGLVVLALKGPPLQEPRTLLFHKYSPFALLGCISCAQPRLSIVAHVPSGGIKPIRETLLRRIAKGPGSVAGLELVHGKDSFNQDAAGLRSANKAIDKALRKSSEGFTEEAASMKFGGGWDARTLEAFFRSADVPYAGANAGVMAEIIAEEGYMEDSDIRALALSGSGAAKGSEQGSIESLENWMKAKRADGEWPSRIEDAVRKAYPHGIPDAKGREPAIKGSLFDVRRIVTAADMDDVLLDLRTSRNAETVSLSIGELAPGMADALIAGVANLVSLKMLAIDLKPGLQTGEVAALLAKLADFATRARVHSIRVNGVELARGTLLEEADDESLDGLAGLLGEGESVADATLELLAGMDVALTPGAADGLVARMSINPDAVPASVWRLPVRWQ